MKGTIIKSLSGFYYVSYNGITTECHARGKFRHKELSPLTGDHVSFSVDENGKGIIDEILPRRNAFIRPPVANIDAMIFVASLAKPVTDPFLIDRVSVIAEEKGIELILCINKTDLSAPEALSSIYQHVGYQIIECSAETGIGIEELRNVIHGKTCALTGNSGVGKSSLLNCLVPGLDLTTAEISEKLGRGKHTTRHVEFFDLGGNTYVADTPGFASFEIDMMENISEKQLQHDFPEFRPWLNSCRFQDCTHRTEPGCSVRNHVESGELSPSRYDSYKRLFDICKANKTYD